MSLQDGKLNKNTRAILDDFRQKEKLFQEIEEETNDLLLSIDLDQTEKRLKEQEEETAQWMAKIDQVCSTDINAKLNAMYELAGMDPNALLALEPEVQFTDQLPLPDDHAENNACMEWNINDVISPMD